jgi:hypothetical protein
VDASGQFALMKAAERYLIYNSNAPAPPAAAIPNQEFL